MIKFRTKIKPLTAAIAGALVFATLSTNAAITVDNAKRVKEAYPLQNDMAIWLGEADQYALNPVNIRGGKHPDRADPEGGVFDVIYIFPDEAAANAWWDPVANPAGMPVTIPDTAVAMVHWELDNGSGSFPGIMSYADVDGFKSRNCIMAAGDVIPLAGVGEVLKTCSNPQGSSKRFKMNVLKADVPIDLVYNVETNPLTYTNYDTLPTFDGVEESGRIYRVLQKWHNTTAMDTASEVRGGVRIVGYRLELGYGVGSAFTRIPDEAGTGLEVDKTLGMEMRPCMPDHFLDISRDRPGTGTNPCSASFDNNIVDYPDDGQPLPQEIWLEEEYGSFSPKMYSTIDDKRMLGIGIPGGFWEKRGGGIFPPEIQTLGVIDSGYKPSDDPVYWDSRVDGATALPGYIGATTPNFFDIINRQATDVGATTVADVPTPYPHGYLPYWGVTSDESYGQFGDYGILPQGIYTDDDGDPASEGLLIAWWDGLQYRWSIDGPVFDGNVTPEEAFMPVEIATLQEWALHPLEEEADFDAYPETGFPAPPLYETGIMDDLGGLNVDYFVYLGRNYDAVTNENFTIRLVTVSTENADPYGDGTIVADMPIAVGDYGNAIPAWVANEAPALETFITNDGIVDISGSGVPGEPLTITVGDIGLTAAPTVTVTSYDTDGVTVLEEFVVTLTQDASLLSKFETVVATTDDPTLADGDATLLVEAGGSVTVTYIDAVDGLGGVDVPKTDTILIEQGVIDPIDPIDPVDPPVVGDDDDGGWCSYHPNGRFDPVLPALVLIGLGYLGLRRKNASVK